MKRFKTTLVLLIAGLFMNLNVDAQEKPKMTEEQRKEFVDQLKSDTDRLALTDAQKEPFRAITKKYSEEIRALRAGSDDKIEKLKQAKTLKIQKDEEVKALLTPEQFKTYQDIAEERRSRMKERRNE